MPPDFVDSSSPSRRRPRLDSSSSSSPSAQPAAGPKRVKLAHASTAGMAMATAKAQGKRPEGAERKQRLSAFQPQAGPRKLVIKNVRNPDARAAQKEEYYARTERELDAGLSALFAGRQPAVPLERLYRGVEDTCRKGGAEKMYRMLCERVDNHLHDVVLPRIRRFDQSSNVEVLRSVLAEWKTWNVQTVGSMPLVALMLRVVGMRTRSQAVQDVLTSTSRLSSARPSVTWTGHICSVSRLRLSTT